jgi:hypothetical protein
MPSAPARPASCIDYHGPVSVPGEGRLTCPPPGRLRNLAITDAARLLGNDGPADPAMTMMRAAGHLTWWWQNAAASGIAWPGEAGILAMAREAAAKARAAWDNQRGRRHR